MVPVGIALIRAELLRSGMHYAVLAQHLIVGLALWVVVDGAPAIVAAHLKISVNHNPFNPYTSFGLINPHSANFSNEPSQSVNI